MQFIFRQPTDKCNRILKLAIGHNRADVIAGVADMQTVNDIFQLFAFVLKMDHVGFGKDGAAAGHIGGLFAFKTQTDKVI